MSKKAKGRYLLFLGAGDLIDASSLNSILQTLQKNNFAILTYDAIEPEFPTYPNLSKNAVIITSSLKDSHIPYFSPSISCNIFERKNFLEATKNIGELRDEWPHAQVALSFARSNLERGYSAQQILQVHPTDSGWSHTQFAYDVLIEYERIMRAFVSSISESVDLYNPNIGINANKVNRILALKLLGVSPKRNQFSDLTKLYAQRSLLFFKFIILCALPANFLKVLRNLHRKTKFFKIF